MTVILCDRCGEKRDDCIKTTFNVVKGSDNGNYVKQWEHLCGNCRDCLISLLQEFVGISFTEGINAVPRL